MTRELQALEKVQTQEKTLVRHSEEDGALLSTADAVAVEKNVEKRYEDKVSWLYDQTEVDPSDLFGRNEDL